MRFGKLVIENFFRIKRMEIDLNSSGVKLIVGENRDTGKSNEAGKSSIWESLSWVLFGKYASGGARAGDEVVNPTVGKNCKVSVEIITDSGKLFVVTRTRKMDPGNTSELLVTVSGENTSQQVFDLRQRNVANTNNVVENILGMDYDTFIRAHYFPQEGVVPFGRMTDKMLKEFFIEKLLNISWVQDCYDTVMEEHKTLKEELERQKTDFKFKGEVLTDVASRIQDLGDNKYKWRADWETRKYVALYEYDDACKLYEKANKALRKKKGELSKIQDQIDAIVIEDINKEMGKIDANMAHTISRIKTVDKELESLAIEIEKTKSLVGTECSSCGNKIKKENLGTIQAKYKSEVQKWESEKKTLTSKLVALENDLVHLKTVERNNIKLQKKKKDLEDKLLSSQELQEVESLDGKRALRKVVLDAIEKEVCPFDELYDKEVEKYNIHGEEAAKISKKIDELGGIIKSKTEFWVKGFSPSGIQSFLLESVTNKINANINKYLGYLSDNRIKAYFTAVKALKSGELREKFGLEIENMDGGNTYASLSGGAKRRVDIACALAIGDFKRSLTNENLDFIVFDEVGVGMDEYWTERMLKMIKERFSSFSTFFITHQSVNSAYFDRTIVVKKEGGETSLEAKNVLQS